MPVYSIQNCKDDTDALIVISNDLLIVGSSYVLNFIPISDTFPPIEGYCRCYRVVSLLPSDGHYFIRYEVEAKIRFEDCKDCLKQHHEKEIEKTKKDYIVKWKEGHCSTEKIQYDFCSFATQSYKHYLFDTYGIECYSKVEEGKWYIRYEIDRMDLLKEPCVCLSTLCFPVCLFDMTVYGEYPLVSCVTPTIQSMDVVACMVASIDDMVVNGYTASCAPVRFTSGKIALDIDNPGCGYVNLSLVIDSIIPV